MNIDISRLKQMNPSIYVVFLLIAAIGSGGSFLLISLPTSFAQANNYTDISKIPTEQITASTPFFVESGKITDLKDLGGNKTEFTYAGNGMLNGNINVTTKGTFTTSLIDGTVEYGKGSGQATKTDGNEIASYDTLYIQNITKDNKLPFTGALVWKANSTSQLNSNGNILGILKGESNEIDHTYAFNTWGWK